MYSFIYNRCNQASLKGGFAPLPTAMTIEEISAQPAAYFPNGTSLSYRGAPERQIPRLPPTAHAQHHRLSPTPSRSPNRNSPAHRPRSQRRTGSPGAPAQSAPRTARPACKTSRGSKPPPSADTGHRTQDAALSTERTIRRAPCQVTPAATTQQL